jgi:very-short-patch-repair endonuclease
MAKGSAMRVGDCERAFAEAAAADGIDLIRYKSPAVNQRGHFGLPPEAAKAAAVLEKIFKELGGRRQEQSAKRLTPLPGDFIHEDTGTVIEVDELQHFTSFRRQTFAYYPEDHLLDFDVRQYEDHCDSWSSRADSYRRNKTAVGFGLGGRQRQRAYYDALRDLVLPAVGHPPIIRIPAVDGDGVRAYLAHRDRIAAAVGMA